MMDGLAAEEVEAALERVLASTPFRSADRSGRLLRFIVAEALQGRADRLKDYTLGAEALGRGEGFDPRTDPIARVEASRLRSRLDVYYATEGAGDAVRILVPKGGYVPRFERGPAPPSPTAAVPVAPSTAGLASAEADRPRRWRWLTVATPLVCAAAAAAATWWIGRPPGADGPAPVRLELATPSTTDPASLALSPDGRTVAFAASAGDRQRLWTRALDSGKAEPLAGTEYGAFPFWSPDGQSLGFFADGRVKAIDLRTRLVRVLSTAPVAAGAAWSPDGTLLHPVVPDSPLFRTTAVAGALEPATRLTTGQTGHRGPTFLPDGRHFLFYAAGRADARGVYRGRLGSFEVTRLLDADAPAIFVPPAQLLYLQQGTLFARRFDAATATVSGEPVRLAEGLAVEPSSGIAAVAAAASGTVVYRAGPVGAQRAFVWFDRQGRERQRVGQPEERGPGYGSISPDGRRLAIQRAVDGNTDIWLLDLERGPAVRFTVAPQADIAPIWSPRGDRIVYASQVDGVFELFEKARADDEPRLLLRTGQAKQATDWSRDGRHVLYRSVTMTPSPDTDIWAVALDGDRRPFPVVSTRFEERDGQFSPDGQWVAYQSNESARLEVYVQPLKAGGERLRVSADGGVQVRWRADGRELFYLQPDGQLMAVALSWPPAGGSPHIGRPVALFQTTLGAVQGVALHSYVASPDGQRFLVDALVERQPPPLSVILNWTRPDR